MAKYLISHDLGTSSNKASLFSTEGELIKSIQFHMRFIFFIKIMPNRTRKSGGRLCARLPERL